MTSKQFEQFYQTLMTKAPKGELSIAEIRIGWGKMMADYPAASDIRMENFEIGKLSAMWIHAPNATKDKVILFFHGGGYTSGDISSHQDLIGRISRASGAYVLAVHYRLAPEHPFPAAVDDALIAYQWLFKQGIQPSQIIPAGNSSGGGLAIALMLSLKKSAMPLPLACVAICPWCDLALTGRTIKSNEGQDLIRPLRLKTAAEAYLHGKNPKDPLASPLYGDLRGLPPLLIQVGSRELLLDEIERFAAKAKEAGVQVALEVFDNMIHCWQLFAAKIPEGQTAIDKIGQFVQTA